MKRVFITVFLGSVALGCGAGGSSTGRLGAEGDSCLRTADCDAPLRCVENVCGGSGSGGDALPSGEVASGDEGTPGAGEDVAAPDAFPFGPPDLDEQPSDEGPTLVEPGEANLDTVEQILADWLGQDTPEAEDIQLPELPPLPDTSDDPFDECAGVGIAPEWSGTFNGFVNYSVPFEIPGAPSEGSLPVLGELTFSVECIEQKLIVVGEMDGTALDQYPFKLHLSGTFNPATDTLKAKITDGKVALFDLGVSTIDVLFAGNFQGTLTSPDYFSGTWDGYSTGTVPDGIPGSATGQGAWNASPE